MVPCLRSRPTRMTTWLPKVSSMLCDATRAGSSFGMKLKLLLSSCALGSCKAKNRVIAPRTATMIHGRLKNLFIKNPFAISGRGQTEEGLVGVARSDAAEDNLESVAEEEARAASVPRGAG